MNRKQLLLIQLMEECDEVSQRASKALRFSLEEIQKGQELSNSQRILYEFNDLVAVMEKLQEEGVFDVIYDGESIKLKKDKIEKFLNYSKQLNILK
jgi:hypothetical protein